ncbi:hypothetical protein ACFFRR_005312 [Megaselia abdita]
MIFKENSIFNSRYSNQLCGALAVNIMTLSHGIQLGWLSPMILFLQSDRSPLDHSITADESSWIGSCLSLGGLLGNFIFGLLLDKIGRKKTVLLLPIPHIILWIIVFFATKVEHFYIARIFAGLCGGGIFVCVPIFIAEISQPRIRGRLGSFFILALNLGVLCGFVVSSYVDYKLTSCVIVILPITYVILLWFLNEPPYYLLRNEMFDEAEKSFKFYCNYKGNSKTEIDNFTKEFNELKQSAENSRQNGGKLSIKDFTTKQSMNALGIAFFLMCLNQFCGVFAFINYSSSMFEKTGSKLDPNINSIILGVVQIIGTYASTIFVDISGRKILLIISSFGMAFGLTVEAVYEHYAAIYNLESYNFIPIVSFCFVIFIGSVGVISISYVVIVEVLPSNIRSIGSILTMNVLCILAFTVLKLFPVAMEYFGLSVVLIFTASFSALGGIFIILFVPETKGKQLE